jgi:hypothetical protein
VGLLIALWEAPLDTMLPIVSRMGKSVIMPPKVSGARMTGCNHTLRIIQIASSDSLGRVNLGPQVVCRSLAVGLL